MLVPESGILQIDESRESRLARLAALVLKGSLKLSCNYPETESLSHCLFLGQHYAEPEPRILMLGLNPGLTDVHKSDTTPQLSNWLLEDGRTKLPYWRNARKFFGAPPALRPRMEKATFSFCCPYRTRNWKLPVAHRRAMMAASRPILQQMLDDCAPRFVIVAGVETERVFQKTAGGELTWQTTRYGPFAKGGYRCRATDATWRGQPLVICQVPHFSRANDDRKMKACRLWLSQALGNDT